MTPYQRFIIAVTGAVSLTGAAPLLAQQEIRPVGQEPPPEEVQFNVQSLAEYGGVLTPRGRLMLEPEFQYTHESINRMTFEGVEILSTLLIGVFTAQDIDRDSYMAALTGRLGVTDRLEIEMKVPYVYRDETSRVSVAELEPAFDIDRTLSNHGLGDIEVAAHYQLNRAREGRPIYIGNLRYKWCSAAVKPRLSSRVTPVKPASPVRSTLLGVRSVMRTPVSGPTRVAWPVGSLRVRDTRSTPEAVIFTSETSWIRLSIRVVSSAPKASSMPPIRKPPRSVSSVASSITSPR